MVSVLFARSNVIGSIVIRGITWSRWSHCALLDEAKGTVIEARLPEVVERPLAEFTKDHTEIFKRTYNGDSGIALAWARKQLGAKYDIAGVLGLGLHRDWQDEGQWWCSELVGKALHLSMPRFYLEAITRLTPEDVWKIL